MADGPQSAKHSESFGRPDNGRWRWIYLGVMVFAVLAVLMLLLFSRHYSS